MVEMDTVGLLPNYLERLRNDNAAFTPYLGFDGTCWNEDTRFFDLEKITQIVTNSPIGNRAIQEAQSELDQNPSKDWLRNLASTGLNEAQIKSQICAIPIEPVSLDLSWERQRKIVEKYGIHTDQVRQAAVYGVTTALDVFVGDVKLRPKLQNVLEKTKIIFCDDGGSRSGITSDGPTVYMNLGIELGKLGWLSDFLGFEVSKQGVYNLSVSTLSHELGHIISRTRALIGDSRRTFAEEFDFSTIGFPILWTDPFGSASKTLCQAEMFAEGMARASLSKLGLANEVVVDYRVAYLATMLAEMKLINPTDLSHIYKCALELRNTNEIDDPVYERLAALFGITKGHQVAVNFPFSGEVITKLLATPSGATCV